MPISSMQFPSRVVIYPSKGRRMWCGIVKIAILVFILTALLQSLAGATSVSAWVQAVIAFTIGHAYLSRDENRPHTEPSDVTLMFTDNDLCISYSNKQSGIPHFSIHRDNICGVVVGDQIPCMQIRFAKKIKVSSHKSSHFLVFPEENREELIQTIEGFVGKPVCVESQHQSSTSAKF